MANNKTLRARFHLLERVVNNDNLVLMGLEELDGPRQRSRYPRFQEVLLLDRRGALLCPRRRANNNDHGLPPEAK